MPRSTFAFIALSLQLAAGGPLKAQVDAGKPPGVWTPTVAAGASFYVAEFGEGNYRNTGAMLRGGMRLPGVDVTLAAEYWPDVFDFQILSTQIETTFFLSRHSFSPVLVASIGHSWSHYTGTLRGIGPNGTSAAVALGFHVPVSDLYGLRTEAVMRTDDGGWDAAFRLLMEYAPAAPSTPSNTPGPGGGLSVFWMIPVHGPWHFVEPGYAIGFERPVNPRFGVDLDLALVHWQVPGAALFRDYIWDTRSFMGLPSVEWTADERGLARLRGGPAVVLMGEGPENGVTLGLHAGVAFSGRSIGVPLSLGVGWLWFSRDNSDPRVGGDDQHGLTLSAGLEF